MERYTKEACVSLLAEKARVLEAQGQARFPKRSDFTSDEVCAIKAFLGPWPRALETAGLKAVRDDGHAEKNRRKRVRAKRRLAEARDAAKEISDTESD